MGYWPTDTSGNSFSHNDEDVQRVWGDQPADILDDALDTLTTTFKDDVGRAPLASEVLAGVMFSLPAYTESPDDSEPRITDDGYTAVIVKTEHLKALRQAWARGADDGLIVSLVRELFDGQDGDLHLIRTHRYAGV